MEREIKFRAWDGKKMNYDGDSGGLYGLRITHDAVWYYEESADQFYWREDGVKYNFMQFTGLKDKNGKEIYEGDIVRTFMGNVCEIRFGHVDERRGNESFEYTGLCFHHIKQNRNYHLDVTSSVEIIGNIYKNPELLKS